jgi:ubiquitin C-terminal hydrolase
VSLLTDLSLPLTRQIDLKDLYHHIQELQNRSSVERGSKYRLSSIICYYGLHYHAFVLKTVPGGSAQWVMFDDTNVVSVGDWSSVINKCNLGRIQPAVLFYQRIKGG